MPGLTPSVDALLREAQDAGRSHLFDGESFDLLRLLGIKVPAFTVVESVEALASVDLSMFPAGRLVLKAMAPGLVHKTEAGAVRVVEARPEALRHAGAAMIARLAPNAPLGFTLFEFVPHDAGWDAQLLVSVRWTDDFGPVATVGLGGVHAEAAARGLRPGAATAIVSPVSGLPERGLLEGFALAPLVTGSLRGRPPRIAEADLAALVRRLLDFAGRAMPAQVLELEINPLALTEAGPVALDVFVRLGSGVTPTGVSPRPLGQLQAMLEPRSIAVVGVSRRRNPGRIILENILASGYDATRVTVIKPDGRTVAGCRCVPDLDALTEPVDLLVLSVPAARIPGMLETVIRGRRAEAVIVIPGGFGERAGSEGLAERLRATLAEKRQRGVPTPVVNGGNCLGIRSLPGRYNTLFIPSEKLAFPEGQASPVAVIAQSGAFAVARSSVLDRLNPRYLITVGNQVDLTVGDCLTRLAEDPEVAVFACYVEGFRPLDGARWLRAARRIVASGRAVILYRAGRTREGADASASHTASIAGDYEVTRGLAERAGVAVAERLDDFDDLLRLFTALRGRRIGPRLAAMSNAGFECVVLADHFGTFEAAALASGTRKTLEELLDAARLREIVAVRNPLDVTPILDDAGFTAAAEALIADPGVEAAVVGCVPLTGALETIPPEGSWTGAGLAARLGALWRKTDKAWVVVVDGGPLYDPFANALKDAGVPVFRKADRALAMLNRYLVWSRAVASR